MVYKSVVGGLNSLQEITGVQQREMDLIGVFLLLLVIDIVYYSSHLCRALAEMTSRRILSALLLHFNSDA